MSENSHRKQFFDDCFLSCSDSESEIALNCVHGKIVQLKNYFSFNQLNLKGSKIEFINFSRKNDKCLQNSVSVVVGSTRIEKSNHCKNQDVTIDKHLDFQNESKKVLKKMPVGIKTIETIQHKFPTTVPLMIFQALALSRFEFLLHFCCKLPQRFYYL